MGAKAAIVYIGEGLPRDALRNAPPFDPVASAELAEAVLGAPVSEVGRAPLAASTWPEAPEISAVSFPDFDLVCFKPLAQDRPSDLTEWIRAMSPAGNACGVFMYSVYDYLSMAVWEHGDVRRSLSLTPDEGILEDLGERYPFETAFWNGDHSIHDFAPDYPFPFHPLELGEATLGGWFGFHLEGVPNAGVDAWSIEMPCYRRTE
ncbi:hypothetical protein O1R50_06960 [Glycomyces luteolus]|uniref:Uncharacterized protein n=1 Tax=Glycomyces luteolus TaxID=2670330 RepID=A0A9X3SQX5_9ACTN|nr:hypothetical protein [Glycomyces luteolus]MDA1359354.1 hypothetical protein [Glycomyces luteolus]